MAMLTTVDNPFDPYTQYDAWQENQTREKGVQEQHGNNRITLQGLFL